MFCLLKGDLEIFSAFRSSNPQRDTVFELTFPLKNAIHMRNVIQLEYLLQFIADIGRKRLMKID